MRQVISFFWLLSIFRWPWFLFFGCISFALILPSPHINYTVYHVPAMQWVSEWYKQEFTKAHCRKGGLSDSPLIPAGFQWFWWILEECKLAGGPNNYASTTRPSTSDKSPFPPRNPLQIRPSHIPLHILTPILFRFIQFHPLFIQIPPVSLVLASGGCHKVTNNVTLSFDTLFFCSFFTKTNVTVLSHMLSISPEICDVSGTSCPSDDTRSWPPTVAEGVELDLVMQAVALHGNMSPFLFYLQLMYLKS